MLKRDITYTDFNGNTVTDTFYFNLSKSELVEMEYSHKEGLGEMLQRLIETQDKGAIIGEFKKLVLQAYGQKSEDGKRFIKNEQLREEFVQSPAYDALFMELAMDDQKAAAFIQGVLPKEMSEGTVNVQSLVNTGTAPLPVPSAPTGTAPQVFPTTPPGTNPSSTL